MNRSEWKDFEIDTNIYKYILIRYKYNTVGIITIETFDNLIVFSIDKTVNPTLQNIDKFSSFVAMSYAHMNNIRYIASYGLKDDRYVNNYVKRSPGYPKLKAIQLMLIQEFQFKDLYLPEYNSLFEAIYIITGRNNIDTGLDLYEDSILNYAYYRHVLRMNPKEFITEI